MLGDKQEIAAVRFASGPLSNPSHGTGSLHEPVVPPVSRVPPAPMLPPLPEGPSVWHSEVPVILRHRLGAQQSVSFVQGWKSAKQASASVPASHSAFASSGVGPGSSEAPLSIGTSPGGSDRVSCAESSGAGFADILVRDPHAAQQTATARNAPTGRTRVA